MTNGTGSNRRKTREADAAPQHSATGRDAAWVATGGNLQRSGEDQPLTRQLGKVGHCVAPYIGFPLYPLQRRRCDLTGHAVADFTFSEAL
jgi:hypothetical protein